MSASCGSIRATSDDETTGETSATETATENATAIVNASDRETGRGTGTGSEGETIAAIGMIEVEESNADTSARIVLVQNTCQNEIYD